MACKLIKLGSVVDLRRATWDVPNVTVSALLPEDIFS
jgi:hypothetical protein